MTAKSGNGPLIVDAAAGIHCSVFVLILLASLYASLKLWRRLVLCVALLLHIRTTGVQETVNTAMMQAGQVGFSASALPGAGMLQAKESLPKRGVGHLVQRHGHMFLAGHAMRFHVLALGKC